MSEAAFVRIPAANAVKTMMVTTSYRWRLTLFFLCALGILVLSLIPVPPKIIGDVLSWDKAQHALAYAVLTGLGGWALTPRHGALPGWRKALLLAICYGVLIEGAQALCGYRAAQFADAVANALGAGTAFLGWRLLVYPRRCKSCS